MIEEIKTDNNCIVKAFENNPISILHEDINNKKVYYFKASDVGNALGIVNIRTTIQNYEDDDERVVRKVYDPHGTLQDTIFLTSQGVYRLLYNSKKEIAKKFRKWAGNILDDIIFNESKELKRQLEEQQNVIEEQKNLVEEKTEQLEEQQKKIKFYENKPSTHGFSARRKGFVYIIKERSKPGHYKIGMSYNVDKRLRNLNTGSSEASLQIYHEIETYDCDMLETTIQKILQPFNIHGRKEWFFLDDTQMKYALHVLHITNEFLNKFNFSSSADIIEYMKCFKRLSSKVLPSEQQKEQPDKTDEQLDEQPKEQVTETNIFKLTRQQSTNRTGNYKGVSLCKEKEKWKAELKFGYKNYFLGYFDTELEGAKVYNDYALYLNNQYKTSYILNEIQDYQAIPRDIPNESKQNILDLKTSLYSGVSYDSSRNYYVVSIKYKGKTYALGNNKREIECAKLYNQQALYFNQEYNTNYVLNEISDPNYTIVPKNIYEEIQENKITKKSSKYHGVTFVKSINKWKALLVYNKKQLHLGFFENELDAAKAYNNKATELNNQSNCKYKINVIEMPI
jgi:prophage antirepressor-like protein